MITISSHVYIGSSKRNLMSRIQEHYRLLRRDKHYNNNMQNWFNQFNEFNVEVLEYCTTRNIIEREQYYISTLKPDINIIHNVARY